MAILGTKHDWDVQYSEEKVKKTLFDLLFYMVYLSIASIISLGTIYQTTYYMADMLNKQLVVKPFDLNGVDPTTNKVDEITFAELTTVPEYWSFLRTQFLDTIYGDGEGQLSFMSPKTENILLGPARLRQVRVRNGTCAIHQLFQLKFRDCYGPFSRANEDTEPFGLGRGTAWTHYDASDLGGIFYWGQLAAYPSGGFYQDLLAKQTASADVLVALQKDNWIDSASRAVLAEFTIYNANLNLFCVAKLLTELPPTGGVLTSASFSTIKLLRFVNSFDYVVLACEVLFLMLTMWFTLVELTQLRRTRCAYFRSFWNFIDLLIIVLAYTSLGFSLYRYVYLSGDNAARTATAETKQHLSLDRLAFGQVQYNTAMAGCVFLVWLKLFKYLSFNRTLMQLSMTLSRCAGDLMAFALMFLIVFVAFAQLGYALFGTENANFRTFTITMMTLLRTVLGDFDYMAIEKANRVLGPIYFVTYIFLVFFVLLNMFLAIINDTYADVKMATSADGGKNQVLAFVRHKLRMGVICLADCCVSTFGRIAGCFQRKDSVKVGEPATVEVHTQSALAEPTADEPNNPSSGLSRCVAIEGVCLQDIFERVSETGPAVDNTDVRRRLHLVEQTMENVVGKLNEFLVMHYQHSKRNAVNESDL